MKTPSGLPSVLIALALLLSGPAGAAAVDRTVDARQFVELLSRQDFAAAAASFDATMLGVLPADKLGQVWQQVNAQAGTFQAQQSVRQEAAGIYDAVLVTCRFEKTVLDIKVVYDAAGKVAGLFFLPSRPAAPPWQAPNYCASGSHEDREVTVGAGEWALSATLSMPQGPNRSRPLPAVVLVHGSGPQDRDETIGPNKPFADLACGLASRGVAVLRYEKRTKQHGQKAAVAKKDFTLREEVVEDALLGAALLRATEGIDAQRLFVLGHSLGGTLAPRIAEGDPGLAGAIVLAGATRPLSALLHEQITYIAGLSGQTPTGQQIQAQVDEITASVPESYIKDLEDSRPTAARAPKQRMLILQGERDYQVTMADFAGWKAALAAHTDVTFKTYSELNHLFMTGHGKSTPGEYETPGHVAPAVIEDIAAWILR